jgi:hypothetical protein
VFLLYGIALEAPFILDDGPVVTNATLGFGTRSLGYASFWLNQRIAYLFSAILPWNAPLYFRFVNLLIHALAGTAVFALARALTGRAAIAAVAGGLFIVHPIQTQAVTYVTQRFESLAALFMFASATSYVHFRQRQSWKWLAASVGSGVAAGFTKETAIVLVLWLLLIEFAFFDRQKLIRRAVHLSPLALLIAYPAWLAFRASGPTLTWVPWHNYFLTQGAILTKYLSLSAWPDQQFLFYDFPIAQGFSWSLALQWLLVIAVIGAGAFCLRRYPVAGFGILTFFVLLLPVTLIPLPDLIIEHRIYPAFAGLAIAASALGEIGKRRSVWVIVGVLAVLWSVRTVQRNSDWNDEVQFLEQHRARFPEHPDVLMRLGSYYFGRGAVNQGLELTLQARRHEERFNDYYRKTGKVLIASNLVFLYLTKGDRESALVEARRAASLDPGHPFALLALGSARFEAGDYAGARDAFRSLTERQPGDAEAWQRLRLALLRLGDTGSALAAARRSNEEAEKQQKALAQYSQIPLRHKSLVSFSFVMVLLGAGAFALHTLWQAVQPFRRRASFDHQTRQQVS